MLLFKYSCLAFLIATDIPFRNNRYIFIDSLHLILTALLCHLSRLFMSSMISFEIHGLDTDLTLYFLTGACLLQIFIKTFLKCVYLQLILDHTPTLHTLNMYECYLNDDDVINLAESTACTHMKRLRFSTGCLQKEESTRRLVYSCHILEVLCLYYCGLGESPTLSCIQFSHLSCLRVLSLYSYNLSETASGVFNNLQTLESLNVADCNMSDIQQLIQIIITLPFLTHLDVHDNKYGSDVLEITKRKHR